MRHQPKWCLLGLALTLLVGCRLNAAPPPQPTPPEQTGPFGQVTRMRVGHPAGHSVTVEPAERVVMGPGEIIVAIAFEGDVRPGPAGDRLRVNGVRPGSALWVNEELQFRIDAEDPGPFQVRVSDVGYLDTPLTTVGFDMERGVLLGAQVQVGDQLVDPAAGLEDLAAEPIEVLITWGAPVERISVERRLRMALGGDAPILWDSDQAVLVRIPPAPGGEVLLSWAGARDQRGRTLWSPQYRFAFQ